MTTIPDKIKIPKNHDRRRKLSDRDKRVIRDLYYIEKKGIREIARKYEHKVCRRTIQFVIFPERDKQLKRIRSDEKRHLKYYDRVKHNKAIKSLRERKRKIFNIKTYKAFGFKKESRAEKARIKKLINN